MITLSKFKILSWGISSHGSIRLFLIDKVIINLEPLSHEFANSWFVQANESKIEACFKDFQAHIYTKLYSC